MRQQLFFLFMLLLLHPVQLMSQTAIQSADDLYAMTMDGDYYLTCDITVEHWSPLGVFTGTFDGRGFCITFDSGEIDANGYGGFFSETNGAVIRNLVTTGDFLGATVASGGMVAHAINTSFLNCETSVVLVAYSDAVLLGGIVGIMEGGMIENSFTLGTFEGYRMGGIAGSTTSTTIIRNSFANDCFIVPKTSNIQVGMLVHDNQGTIENCYSSNTTEGWFLPTIGQLTMMYGLRGIYLNKNTGINLGWADGYCLSSSFSKNGYVYCIDHDGTMTNRDFSIFNNGTVGQIKSIHDVYGIGYNVGDLVIIGGVESIVFFVNEDGYGGWAFHLGGDNIKNQFLTSNSNAATSDFYFQKRDIEAINIVFAQAHDGNVVGGGTTNAIPAEYRQNTGKYITRLLRQTDRDPVTKINSLRRNVNKPATSTMVKQLAYLNSGTISQCYYPIATNVQQLVNNGTTQQCEQYNAIYPPYKYGEFGPTLYQGSILSETALMDKLNAWVDAQPTDGYAHWTEPGVAFINGNLPILEYGFDNGTAEVNTAVQMETPMAQLLIRYSHLNHLPGGYKTNSKAMTYYGHCGTVNADNFTNTWKSHLYIAEDATLKGNFQLKANVSVTLDNSDASGFAGGYYDWHFVSTPLTNAPVGILYQGNTNGGPFGTPKKVSFNQANGYFPTNSPYASWDFYCFDEINSGWLNFKRSTGDHYNPHSGLPINYTNETNLLLGKGYLWAVADMTELQALGILNNDEVSVTLTKQGTHFPGYNLVGNPYHAFLDFDAFCEDNELSLAQPSYTLLDADKHGYITYCQGASNNPAYAPKYLRAHQGFFIQAARDQAMVTFSPDQTVLETNADFREDSPQYPLVNLILTDADGNKEYATAEIERPQAGGALKMKGLERCHGTLSIGQGMDDYSIAFLEGRPRTIPVRFKANENGVFKLEWYTLNGDFGSLRLVDHLTGMEVDCLTQSEYVFTASTQDFQSRFLLMLDGTELDEKLDIPTESFAYYAEGELSVLGPGRLTLCDLQGHLLLTKDLNEGQHRFPLPKLAQGIYVVHLTNKDRISTQKIIIY